jgi:hypothetical protein
VTKGGVGRQMLSSGVLTLVHLTVVLRAEATAVLTTVHTMAVPATMPPH